jgi:hypothetical protein
MRPSGTLASIGPSFPTGFTLRNRGVSTGPGATELTVIPIAAASRAASLVSASTAAFEAA